MAAVGAGGSAGAATVHGFRQINLVSDIPGKAQLTDHNLVNPWGLAAGPTTPLWAADNGTGVATLYLGGVGGSPIGEFPVAFTVPQGRAAGQVFNPTNGFKLRVGDTRVPAKFIFDSEAGVISAWTLTNPIQPNVRQKLVVPGAVFKGLAVGFFEHHPALYATDFAQNRDRRGRLALPPSALPGVFRDPMMPSTTHRSASRRSATGCRHLRQAGCGSTGRAWRPLWLRRRLHPGGKLVKRLRQPRPPERPLGPGAGTAAFGRFGGALLVGNFGDGRIHAYDIAHRPQLGPLRRPSGAPSPSTACGGCASATASPEAPTS